MLRDDNPDIPYPDMWDMPGGHVEDGETPAECIIREMDEEMGIDVSSHELFKVYDFSDRIEYVYSLKRDFDIREIILTEGQAVKWFRKEEIEKIEMAYGFNEVARDFYKELKVL